MKIEKIQFLRNVSTIFGMRFKGEVFTSPDIPEDVIGESKNAKNVKVFYVKEQENEVVSEQTEERIESSMESSEATIEIVAEHHKEVKSEAKKSTGRPKKKK